LHKKEFSSVDISVSVQELKEKILNSRINKIYQHDKKTITLKLHKTDSPQIRLVMEAGRRIHLTSYVLKPPKIPPGFCMALRKHLSGAWIDNIEQYKFERIVLLHLRKRSGNWKLILELFGEGNIILTDEKNIILQALIFKRMRDRNILRNESFKFPPSRSKNPFEITKEELKHGIVEFGETEIVRAIARLLGFGGLYSEEILSKANIEKTKLSCSLQDSEFEAIFNSVQNILSAITTLKIQPSIILNEDDQFLDAIPITLNRYKKFNFKAFKTFNEVIDKFYLKDTAHKKAIAGGHITKLEQEVERLERIVSKQKQVLFDEKKNILNNKILGDTIYSHSREIQLILDYFLARNRVGKEWTSMFKKVLDAKKAGKNPATLVESFDSRNLLANLYVGGLRFNLNLRKSLFENAAKYYNLSKKSKQKSEGAFSALKNSLNQQEELKNILEKTKDVTEGKPDQILTELEKTKIQNKKWYEKFRWYKDSSGYLVVAGKDSVSNEVLIKKYAEPDDPVFHADITGAPFVVIKSTGNPISEKSISEAGEFAASFSRAWREGAGSADVYWVKPSQLTKGGPSGEYVSKGSFVVTGKRNWIRNVPLKLAIGLVKEATDFSFIGGPLNSVKALTSYYVILIPGDLKGKDLLTKTMRSLILKLPKKIRETIPKTSIEQIRAFIPFTKGRIGKD